MSLTFLILAVVTLAGAAGAMFLPRPVHCALSLIVALSGLAMLFLRLGAQFVGFAQILIYVGAVGILVVFAILLTRDAPTIGRGAAMSPGWLAGLAIAAAVFVGLATAIVRSAVSHQPTPPAPTVTVHDLGARLMDQYVLPLEVAGLLLTAALIGAVAIALHERKST